MLVYTFTLDPNSMFLRVYPPQIQRMTHAMFWAMLPTTLSILLDPVSTVAVFSWRIL